MRFREPEIEELRPGFCQHHVVWLQVAMDNARAMRLVERVCDLDGDRRDLIDGHPSSFDPAGKGLAVEMLEHEVVNALLAADIVEGADVWMIQGGDRFGLTVEPIPELRVSGQRLLQNLDCDDAIEACVSRFVDVAHAALTNRGLDHIRPERGAGNEGHK